MNETGIDQIQITGGTTRGNIRSTNKSVAPQNPEIQTWDNRSRRKYYHHARKQKERRSTTKDGTITNNDVKTRVPGKKQFQGEPAYPFLRMRGHVPDGSKCLTLKCYRMEILDIVDG